MAAFRKIIYLIASHLFKKLARSGHESCEGVIGNHNSLEVFNMLNQHSLHLRSHGYLAPIEIQIQLIIRIIQLRKGKVTVSSKKEK